MVIRKPQYYDTFRCAAGACPDSCCHQWEVQVDADAAERYRALPGPWEMTFGKSCAPRTGKPL